MESLKDWLPAIAILGPIIAAIITALVGRHFRDRRRVNFGVARSENLTLPLSRNNKNIIVKMGDIEVSNLNRSIVYIANVGNVSIKNFVCELRFPGEHRLLVPEVFAISELLKNAVTLKFATIPAVKRDVVSVSASFINPGESFQVSILFDNEAVDCEVIFRVEGVQSSVSKNRRITAFAPELIDALLAMYPPGLRQLAQILLRITPRKRK